MISSAFVMSSPSTFQPLPRRVAHRTSFHRTYHSQKHIQSSKFSPPTPSPAPSSSTPVPKPSTTDSKTPRLRWPTNIKLPSPSPSSSTSSTTSSTPSPSTSSLIQRKPHAVDIEPAALHPLSATTPAAAPSASSPPPIWPRLLALFVAAVFGTNFPVVKFIQSGSDPLPASIAALARFSLAACALIPPALVELRKKPALDRKFVWTASLIGVPVFLGYFTQALSLDGTDAGKSAFLCSLAVVVVPLLQRLFNIIPLNFSSDTTSTSAVDNNSAASKSSLLTTWGAPFLAVCGVALLELSDASPPTVADAWGLAQAFAFGTGFIMNEFVANEYPGYPLTTSALQLATIALCSLGWSFFDSSFSFPHLSDAFATVENTVALLYAGLISTALTIVLSNIALAKVTAGELTVLLSTEPVWAAVFSAVTLDERMGAGAIAGALIILVACLVNQADVLPSFITNMLPKRNGPHSDKKFGSKKYLSTILATPIASLSAFASSIQDIFNKNPPPPS